MIMKDCITAKQRLNFNNTIDLVDYKDHVCAGCNRPAKVIAYEDGCDDWSFEEYSRTTNGGNWYCHIDCYKDCF